MMDDNDSPTTKRLRLSLEPSIDPPEWDITDAGDKKCKSKTSLSEQLMLNVDRVWKERGEWRDISEQNLSQSIAEEPAIENVMEIDIDTLAAGEQARLSMVDPMPANVDIRKLRDSVVKKLHDAKGEIDVALDVINILAASQGTMGASQHLMLPPGSIYATYVAKPKPTPKAHLEAIQLAMGLKRKQQREAAAFLTKRADSLKKMITSEHAFWEEALDMRRNHWPMQLAMTPGPSLWVQYGFTDMGSNFKETSLGRMERPMRANDLMHLVLPHHQSSTLRVSIDKNSPLERDSLRDTIDGPTEPSPLDTAHTLRSVQPASLVQKQLLKAQSTVFDTELFAKILLEAQELRNVRFAENQIIVAIDGQTDLTIHKRTVNAESDDSMETETSVLAGQHITGEMIDLAMRLLLIQKHQQQILKSRARLTAVLPKPSLHDKEKEADVSILPAVRSMAQFWTLFDGIRHTVDAIVGPVCRQGGLEMMIHSKFHTHSKASCYGTLTISVLHGPALYFSLDLLGKITVSVRHLTVTLTSLAEFEAFLLREIDLICLDRVCNVANALVRLSSAYKCANQSEKGLFLWKVDGVEETLNGSVCWRLGKTASSHTWRKSQVRVVRTSSTYMLVFRLNEMEGVPLETRRLVLSESCPSKAWAEPLNFNEKVQLELQDVMSSGTRAQSCACQEIERDSIDISDVYKKG